MMSSQSSNANVGTKLPDHHREDFIRCFVVLVSLMAATLYLATGYSHPQNWQSQARLLAFTIVSSVVVWAIRKEHTDMSSTFVSGYLLGSAAISMTVFIIRLLFPLTSTPDTFNGRINLILNEWLAWPITGLAMLGFWLLLVSVRARSSASIYVALILCGSIMLSMNGEAQAFLRALVYKLPYGPRL
jgi:hypothetical protein|nr:hypothetical protein [Planctomicrobium sp.]